MPTLLDTRKNYHSALCQLISAYKKLEKFQKNDQALNSYLSVSKLEFDTYQKLRAKQDAISSKIETQEVEMKKVEVQKTLPWLVDGIFLIDHLNSFQPPVNPKVFDKYMDKMGKIKKLQGNLSKAEALANSAGQSASAEDIQSAKAWSSVNIKPRVEEKCTLDNRLCSTFEEQLFDGYQKGVKGVKEVKVEARSREEQKDDEAIKKASAALQAAIQLEQETVAKNVSKQALYRSLFLSYVKEKIPADVRIKGKMSPIIKTKVGIDKINLALQNVSLEEKQDSRPSLIGLFKDIGIQFENDDLDIIYEKAKNAKNVKNEKLDTQDTNSVILLR